MDNYKVADIFGPDKCKALLSLHAFMGCDTVRAFDGKGKVAGITWQTHAPWNFAEPWIRARYFSRSGQQVGGIDLPAVQNTY